jgi:hypothetical protein
MFYQESAILVGNKNFIEEDVLAVDTYLYNNQEKVIRIGRTADFTDVGEAQLENMFAAYVAVGVLQQTSLPICGRDDTPIEQPDEQGNYFCDICEQTFAPNQLAFEPMFIPRATNFECGDLIPIACNGLPSVDGIEKISGCSSSSRIADVVFIHGLDGDAKSTWHPKNVPTDFFPKWLGEEFPNVGVWTLGYEASSSGWKGTTMPLVDRATNVLARLEAAGIGQRPLVFVVHSLGGLVVKQLLSHATGYGKSEWEQIATSTKAIMFLATPHSGSDVSKYIQYIGKIYRASVTVEELESHHPALRNLNLWFRNNCAKFGIFIDVLFETQPTNGFLVVNETNADPGIVGVIPIPVDSDHITICKPSSKSDLVFSRACLLVKKVLAKK